MVQSPLRRALCPARRPVIHDERVSGPREQKIFRVRPMPVDKGITGHLVAKSLRRGAVIHSTSLMPDSLSSSPDADFASFAEIRMGEQRAMRHGLLSIMCTNMSVDGIWWKFPSRRWRFPCSVPIVLLILRADHALEVGIQVLLVSVRFSVSLASHTLDVVVGGRRNL